MDNVENVLPLPNPTLDAALSLFGESSDTVTTHDYRTLEGDLSFVAVFGYGTRRYMRRDGDIWTKIKRPALCPLYRLPQIVRSTTADIWLVPDERDADVLTRMGLLTTRLPSKDTDIAALADRSLILWGGVLTGQNSTGIQRNPTVKRLAGITSRLEIVDPGADLPNVWLGDHPGANRGNLYELPRLTLAELRRRKSAPVVEVEEMRGPIRPKIVKGCDGEMSAKIDLTTYHLSPSGLWAEEWRESGTSKIYLGEPLRIVAETMDEHGDGFGRLIEWKDSLGRKRQMAIPLDLTVGDGLEIVKTLVSKGWRTRPGQKVIKLVCAYLLTWPVEERMTAANSLGWLGKRDVYVTPERIINEKPGEKIVYQPNLSIRTGFSLGGTFDGWMDEVARYARGNSRLTFAICAALAGPLLRPLDKYGGGFHFHSDSTTGKTSALRVAASVWGDHQSSNLIRQWRSTENALEGIACASNDGILLLDELRQADPRAVGQIAYMLANGQGRQRMTKGIDVREAFTWRLIFLSTGEHTLQQMMNEASQKTVTGQALRIPSIPCELGPMGIIEELHGFESSRALMQKGIEPGVNRHYGHAGQAWLDRIVPNIEEAKKQARKLCERFERECLQKSNQVLRVAERFGIVAAAGELATEYGITGWKPTDAWNACLKCFDDWFAFEGPGSEAKSNEILADVRGLVETKIALFPDISTRPEQLQKIPTIYGYTQRDKRTGDLSVLVNRRAFEVEICGKRNPKVVKEILRKAGWLAEGHGGRDQQYISTPFAERQWYYVLTEKALSDPL